MLCSTRVESLRRVAVCVQIREAIEVTRLQVQREPGSWRPCQRHSFVRMPHSPALSGSRIPLPQLMRGCRRSNDFHVLPARAIFLLASIQPAAPALFRCEDLLEVATPELHGGSDCRVVLLRGRVHEMRFPMLFHPGCQVLPGSRGA